jgi:hypothetical protein
MPLNFNYNNIEHCELIVNYEENGADECYFVPIDRNVQSVLNEVLLASLSNFGEGFDNLRCYEFSEKYASRELLRASVQSTGMERIRELYGIGTGTCVENHDVLEDASNIDFYFVKYKDNNDRYLIGVRRATQFKGVLSAKNRLVRLIDNTLHLIDDDIFKLDKEFDFLIDSDSAFIIHPSGFEQIADVEQFVSERAYANALALRDSITFVDFTTIATYVSNHKRAAKIVAGLRIRNDLDEIQLERLLEAATSTQVEFIEQDGIISPAPGNELGFLELLDNRRYNVSLTMEPQSFVADSRRMLSTTRR